MQSGSWRGGGYTEIEIFEPKHRLVSAAPFRDRVVHHALCSVIAPIFESGRVGTTLCPRGLLRGLCKQADKNISRGGAENAEKSKVRMLSHFSVFSA